MQACGEDVAGRLHTARSRNDIDMTMYRMRQRGLVLDLLGASLDLRAVAARTSPSGTARPCSPPTRTRSPRSRPPSRTTCSPLSSSSSATRSGCGPPSPHQREPARRVRDHRHRLPDRPRPHERAAGIRRADREHLRQHRHGRLPAARACRPRPCCSSGLGRLLQDLLLWCTLRCSTCGWPTASCRAAASCRRSGTRWRSSTRAPSRAMRSARPPASALAVHNTPFGDIVDTEDDLQPLVHAAFRDATRAVRLVAAAMDGADFNRELMEARAGRELDHRDGAGRHADARPRPRLPAESRHRGDADRRARWLIPTARLGRCWTRRRPRWPASASTTLTRNCASCSVREHFVEVRTTWGGPAPEETARAMACARRCSAGDRHWLADRAWRWPSRAAAAPAPAGRRAMTTPSEPAPTPPTAGRPPDALTYIGVVVVQGSC